MENTIHTNKVIKAKAQGFAIHFVPTRHPIRKNFNVCLVHDFLITIFENKVNIILVFFENCYCYLNLIFIMCFYFFKNCKQIDPWGLFVYSF